MRASTPGCEPCAAAHSRIACLLSACHKAFRAVPAAGWGHPGRMSEVLLAGSALPAFGDQRYDLRPAWQVRPFVARLGYQGAVSVVILLGPAHFADGVLDSILWQPACHQSHEPVHASGGTRVLILLTWSR